MDSHTRSSASVVVVVVVVTVFVGLACLLPAQSDAAPLAPWPEAATGVACKRLFAETGTDARRLRLDHQTLRFWESGPAEPDAAQGLGIPVLFVHGYYGDLCDFGPLLVAEARQRRVVAFDLPNFGESSQDEDATIDTYVQLLADLVARMKLGRVHLVCHSMGGQVCIGVGLTSPSFVESVTLIDAAGVYERSGFPAQVSKRLAGVNLGSMVAAKGRTVLDLIDGNRVLLRHLGTLNPAIWTAVSSFQSSYRSKVRKLVLPVLVIWGREDPIFSIDSAFLLKESIRGSVLHIIDGAGHSPQLSHPSQTFSYLQRFHDRVEDARRALSAKETARP